jgi:hypothetical protein
MRSSASPIKRFSRFGRRRSGTVAHRVLQAIQRTTTETARAADQFNDTLGKSRSSQDSSPQLIILTLPPCKRSPVNY